MRAPLLLLLPIALLASAPPAHWGYDGKEGPRYWGELSPEFAACSLGHRQSPIDIRNAPPAKLQPLGVHYEPVPLRAINNGHTIEVKVPEGGGIVVGTHHYRLVQFHFHAPSEEAIEGKRHALVAHLVHEDTEGKKAVVAVLFDVGAESTALGALFADLPQKPGLETIRSGETIRLDKLLPLSRSYFEFQGSLTTPPCTEGVQWFVLKQPVTLSEQQLAAFRALYPKNARPLQPAAGRLIRQSAE